MKMNSEKLEKLFKVKQRINMDYIKSRYCEVTKEELDLLAWGLKQANGLDITEILRDLGTAKFMEVENSSNKGYDEIVSNFESIASQLPLVEKKLMALKTEIGSLNNTLTKKKSELAGIQSQLVQFREETMAEKTRLNAELEAEMKRFGVTEQEIKEAAKLKNELAKRGLNLSTLIKVAEEFPDDSN